LYSCDHARAAIGGFYRNGNAHHERFGIARNASTV
jgi:hypothetical protein